MPAPKVKAECTVTLCDQPLKLSFKSYNLYVLTDLTGKTPIEYVQKFEGVRSDAVGDFAKKVCDFSFIVPLIVAGLADHPEYEDTTPQALRKKVCKLIDSEAEKDGKGLLITVMELAGAILPAVIASLAVPGQGDKAVGDTGNAKAPAVEAGEVSSIGAS